MNPLRWTIHLLFTMGPLKFAAWSSGLETPKMHRTENKEDKIRLAPSVICEWSENVENSNAAHLKFCASAGFDIFRSEPLPHFDQSQAFSLIDVKHSLMTETERKKNYQVKCHVVSLQEMRSARKYSRASGGEGSTALVSSTNGTISAIMLVKSLLRGSIKTAPAALTVTDRIVLVALLFEMQKKLKYLRV